MNSFFKGLFLLYRREIKESLTGPLTYVVTALFCFLIGWLFFNYIMAEKAWTQMTIERDVWMPCLGSMNFIFLFLSPMLTMKHFSFEKKMGTLDLLLTSRLNHWQIIVGKFLSSLTLVIFMILSTGIIPVTLILSGYNGGLGMIVSYLGIIFSTSCYLAVGLFTSSFCKNQITSSLLAFCILLGIVFLLLVGKMSPHFIVGQFFTYMSIPFHFEGMVQGVLKSYHLIYFGSFIGFFFFLTERSLDSRNW